MRTTKVILDENDDLMQPVDEAAMNPTEFGRAIQQGQDKGVMVGYEFEVCIPQSTVTGKVRDESSLIRNNWEDFVESVATDDVPIEEFDSVFKFKKPVNGFSSMSDVYQMVLETKLTKARELFNRIPEALRAEVIPLAKEQAREQVKTYQKRDFNPSNLYDQLVFAKRVGTYAVKALERKRIYRGAPYEAARELYYTGTDVGYWELCSVLIRGKIVNDHPSGNILLKALENFEYDPQAAFALIDKHLYLEDDEDEDYDAAAKVLQKALKATMGKKVVVFHEYHEDDKDMKRWYIEPDGSLDPSTPGDSTAEIVGPPTPALQAIEDLKKFYAMAEQLKLYANNTTGLHINVSIPQDLDVLKLAVFLGDEYVLKQYGRLNNRYSDSVGKATRPEALASDSAYRNSEFSKQSLQRIVKNFAANHTSSISYNGNYVSFRHAGGNYLADFNKVYNTVGRFIRAMIIASDPSLYAREYQTKVGKIVSGVQATPPLKSPSKIQAARNIVNYIRANGVPTIQAIVLTDPAYNVNQIKNSLKFGTNWYLTGTYVNHAVREASPEERQQVLAPIQNPESKEIASGYRALVITMVPKNPNGFVQVSKVSNYVKSGISKIGRATYLLTTVVTQPPTSPTAQGLLKQLAPAALGKTV